MGFLNTTWTAELILNLAVQLFLILASGWIFCFFLRNRSAPLRSGISLATMLAVVFLLLFSSSEIVFNRSSFHTLININIDTNPDSAVNTAYTHPLRENTIGAAGTTQSNFQKGLHLFTLPGTNFPLVQAVNLFGIFWGFGLIILSLRFSAGLYSILTLKKESTKVRNSRILRILNEAKQSFLKLNKIRVYSSSKIPYPMAVGIFKPFILIPKHLMTKLPDNQIQGIFLHELSHIYHQDHIIGLLQRLVKIINWWNPFSYALCRIHTRAREEISDNHVLLSQNSKDYAECLINLADKTPYFKQAAASTGMGSSHIPLKDRIKHILSKERTMETSMKKRDFVIITLAALIILTGVTGTRFIFSSDIKSPKIIKKVEPIYPQEAKQAGIEGTVVIAAQTDSEGNVNQIKILKSSHDLLNKAAVEALIQWKCEPMIIDGAPYGVEFTAEFRFSKEEENPEIEISTGAAVSEGVVGGVMGGVKEGVVGGVIGGVEGGVEGGVVGRVDEPVRAVGDIKPPRLIKKVEPVYPEKARRAQVEGVVILEATTDKDGKVESVRVLKPVPMLNQAAVDAVKQWEYEPVIIDGEPRGAVFTVTVNFQLKNNHI